MKKGSLEVSPREDPLKQIQKRGSSEANTKKRILWSKFKKKEDPPKQIQKRGSSEANSKKRILRSKFKKKRGSLWSKFQLPKRRSSGVNYIKKIISWRKSRKRIF
jgi:hypothetical protein